MTLEGHPGFLDTSSASSNNLFMQSKGLTPTPPPQDVLVTARARKLQDHDMRGTYDMYCAIVMDFANAGRPE